VHALEAWAQKEHARWLWFISAASFYLGSVGFLAGHGWQCCGAFKSIKAVKKMAETQDTATQRHGRHHRTQAQAQRHQCQALHHGSQLRRARWERANAV
jgi:hypothetical protein